MYYLTPAEIEHAAKISWIEVTLTIMTVSIAKISVALLILRIPGPSGSWRKGVLYTSIVLSFVIGASTSIVGFVQCSPPRALWEGPMNVPGARCWNPNVQVRVSTFQGSTLAISI